MSLKSRNFVFTKNNYNESDVAWLNLLECRYMVYGKEIAPTTGTPHLQGFVCFPGPRHLRAVQLELGCHVEIAKGSVDQNYEYCTKGGDFYEKGQRPMSQKRKGEVEQEAWSRAKELVRNGELGALEERFAMNLKKLEYYVQQESLAARNLEDATEKMEWYYGASGTGKSRRAREENPDAYLKMCNKWWDGYKGEDVVIIEDFDKAHEVLCHHMKIWLDRYPFPAEVKGGTIKIRPKKIIITSNYHPNQIWVNEQDLLPILRRIKITHFTYNLFNTANLN